MPFPVCEACGKRTSRPKCMRRPGGRIYRLCPECQRAFQEKFYPIERIGEVSLRSSAGSLADVRRRRSGLKTGPTHFVGSGNHRAPERPSLDDYDRVSWKR